MSVSNSNTELVLSVLRQPSPTSEVCQLRHDGKQNAIKAIISIIEHRFQSAGVALMKKKGRESTYTTEKGYLNIRTNSDGDRFTNIKFAQAAERRDDADSLYLMAVWPAPATSGGEKQSITDLDITLISFEQVYKTLLPGKRIESTKDDYRNFRVRPDGILTCGDIRSSILVKSHRVSLTQEEADLIVQAKVIDNANKKKNKTE